MAIAGRRRKMPKISPTPPPEGKDAIPIDIVNIKSDEGHKLEQPWEPDNYIEDIEGISDRQASLTPLPTRHAIIDSKYVPKSHIINNLEGDPWTVDYYQQRVGVGDMLQPLQLGTPAPYQQYNLIKRLVLKVTQPIDPSQDSESMAFNVTGTAGVFFGLKPNKHDMFLADIGDGRCGVFTVTESQRMSHTNEACYNIEYKLVYELNEVVEADFNKKTVETFVYVPEMIELLDNPFLTEANYAELIELNDLHETLSDSYERRYWSHEARTFAIPQQEELSYDAWHTRFITDVGVVDTRFRNINNYSNGIVKTEDVYTVWDCLLDMSDSELPYLQHKLGLTEVYHFKNLPVMRSIAWTHFTKTVYPKDVSHLEDSLDSFEVSNVRIQGENTYTPTVVPGQINPRRNLMTVFNDVSVDDGYYIFSKAFYTEDLENCCLLEWAMLKMLRGDRIRPEVPQLLGTEIRKQPHLLQYYYIPVILLLINYCRRSD